MSHLLEILGRGLIGELAAAFRTLLDGEPSHGQADADLIRIGTAQLHSSAWSAARETFTKAVMESPGDLRARAGLACALDQLGETNRALAQLRDAERDHAGEAALQFAIGFCAEKLGRTGEAALAYSTALGIAPSLRNAHERLAALALQQGELGAAIERYEHICFHEPGEIDSILMLAGLYLRAGRFDEAIRRYRLALTLDPDNWDAGSDLVEALSRAGLVQEAIAHLTGMIREQPVFADNHLRLGDLYARAGQTRDALEQYLEAARINPDYLEAAIKIGTSLLRAGTYPEAARWFSRAVEINDRLLTAFVGLGVAQIEQGRLAEAEESFRMAEGVEPNSTLLFSEMAKLQLRSTCGREAARWLGPDAVSASPPPPTGITELLHDQIERCRAAVEKQPTHADLHYRLGLLLKQSGRTNQAIAAFQEAVRINPNYEKALIKLGLSLYELGRCEDAVVHFRRAITQNPQAVEMHYRLGLIFADRNQFDLAIEQFEHAASREPERLEFRANLALALQNMGLVDRAESSWQILTDLASQSEEGLEIISKAVREQQA